MPPLPIPPVPPPVPPPLPPAPPPVPPVPPPPGPTPLDRRVAIANLRDTMLKIERSLVDLKRIDLTRETPARALEIERLIEEYETLIYDLEQEIIRIRH